MTKNLVVFGASSSKKSINQRLAVYASSQIKDVNIKVLDLNDFEMPIFSTDREKETGIPQKAQLFYKLISESDGLIISFAEHNGTYSAAFKNIYDWISRLKGSIWADKPILALATSPGRRGGGSVLEHALSNLPRRGANIVASFSLPSFEQNFSEKDGITDDSLRNDFIKQLVLFDEFMHENTAII